MKKYKYIDSFGLDFSLIDIGYAQCTKEDISLRPRKLDYFSIHCVVNGKGHLIIGDQHFKLKKDDIFFIYPGVQIQRYPDEFVPYEIYWIDFSGQNIDLLLNRLNISPECPILKNPSKRIYNILKKVINFDYTPSIRFTLATLTALVDIFSILLEHYDKEENINYNEKKSSTDLIRKALDYIDQNYATPNLSLTNVANHIGLNANYFSRLFKTSIGENFTTYITNLRMKRACSLLEEKKYKIYEIAEKVGYSDPLYFSKVFLKYADRNPSHYPNDSPKYKK